MSILICSVLLLFVFIFDRVLLSFSAGAMVALVESEEEEDDDAALVTRR